MASDGRMLSDEELIQMGVEACRGPFLHPIEIDEIGSIYVELVCMIRDDSTEARSALFELVRNASNRAPSSIDEIRSAAVVMLQKRAKEFGFRCENEGRSLGMSQSLTEVVACQ